MNTTTKATSTKTSFRKVDERNDSAGSPIRTYEVRIGNMILGTVCGEESTRRWTAKAGLGLSAIPINGNDGIQIQFESRTQAAHVLRAFVVGRTEHLTEKAEKLGKVLAGSTWWHQPEPEPKNLAELRDALIAGKIPEANTVRLPTFGGEWPENTHGIFSWDATHLLVQNSSGWAIVERPAKVVHAVGSDGCAAVCGSDLDDSAVSADDIAKAANPCPECLADCAEVHAEANPDGCAPTWSAMCPDCCQRLGATSVPIVHLQVGTLGTVCGAIGKATPIAAAVTCPECQANEVKMSEAKALQAADLTLQDAIEAIEGAMAARPDSMRNPRADRMVSSMIWRLVDAAALLARLAPNTDIGLKVPTGRGARLDLGDTGYAAYVHRADGTHGYLTKMGSISPWSGDAAVFTTVDAVNARIEADGILNSTGALSGRDTAYAVSVTGRSVTGSRIAESMQQRLDENAKAKAEKAKAVIETMQKAIRIVSANSHNLERDQAAKVASLIEASFGRKPTAAEWTACGFEWVGSEHVLIPAR